jgi:phosphoenolpyruvate carboxykinase (GTP)
MPVDRAGMGGPGRRADRRLPVRRPRARVVPLVFEALDWEHGVFLAAQMSSETTAAAAGAVGKLRRDPMAMLPFCGYNMGDYFAHWLSFSRSTRGEPSCPRSSTSTGSAKGADGRWLWPGFGENRGVDVTPGDMKELLTVHADEWRAEVPLIRKHFAQFGDRLPVELATEIDQLEERLKP